MLAARWRLAQHVNRFVINIVELIFLRNGSGFLARNFPLGLVDFAIPVCIETREQLLVVRLPFVEYLYYPIANLH